jgi:hypothetical protein
LYNRRKKKRTKKGREKLRKNEKKFQFGVELLKKKEIPKYEKTKKNKKT